MKSPYKTREWQRVRFKVFDRDRRVCQIKHPKCRGYATQVHHLVDWRDGGEPYEMSNLVAACASCNVAERNTRIAAAARRARGLETPVRSYHNERW